MSEHDAVRRSFPWPLSDLARRRDRTILKACRAATRRVTEGRLRLTLPSGETAVIGHPHEHGSISPDAAVTLVNFRAFYKALARGSIGFADAYMAGDVKSPDLVAVFRFYLANKTRLDDAGRGQFKVRRQDTVWHKRRDNSRDGSRRNIAAHYDLGNAFYAPWLDASMTYSSAIYRSPNDTLEAAQAHKLDRIVAALDLKPGMHVLEIGCGWGALSERIAREGCRVTAVTVSEEQHAFARARIAAAGLSDQVDIQFRDYRDIAGAFDRIVSIEMIEAVGEAHWPSYFGALAAHLKPGGHAVLQAITMDDANFEAYRRKADFIQRYIFPGGMLLTPDHLQAQSRGVGLTCTTLATFGKSYAHTLRAWRDRFDTAWPSLERLGFDDRFRRMWTYYFTYCEAGFDAGATDVGLYRIDKPA
jgi:cyclopropane-fatty-acyl-phospholipid synthase